MSQETITRKVPSDFPIIDVHNHVFSDHIALRAAGSIRDYYELPMYGDGTLSCMLERARGYRVEHFLICSASLRADKVRAANEFTAVRRAVDPRIVALGTTHAGVPDQYEVFRQIEAFGLAGIKIHPEFQGFAVDDERLNTAWEEAIRLRLPVLFHIGDPKSDLSSPRRLYRVMERYPQLKVVAAHMGGYQSKEEAECLVGTHCWFDTSQWFYFMSEEELLSRIERHGADKVIYGCDYPLNVPDAEIERLYATALSEEDKRKIFYANAKALFRL